MARSNRYDVLIVGARCAGAATAMLMARRGLKVLVIDKGEYGSDTLSTHALMRGGVIQLSRWGLLDRLVEGGTPPARTTTFRYGAEAVEIPIKPGHGADALYAPRRTLLDSILVDAARQAGADVRHGHALDALVHGRDGRVAGAAIRNAQGRTITVEADLVVGADGVGSKVARLAAAPLLTTARHGACTVYGYWSGLAMSGYHWCYGPGISTGVIPTNDDQHCIFVSMSADRFRAIARTDMHAGYRRTLAEVSPELADGLASARPESRLWPFAGRKGFLRRPYGPGWALVGDAGYFKDPLTAHGITDAFRDAELLADAAERGTERAFVGYAQTRDALSMDLFRVTDAIASLDWSLDELKSLHRDLSEAMKREVDHLVGLDAGRSTAAPSRHGGDPVAALQI